MKRTFGCCALLGAAVLLSACGPVGDKSANLSAVYATTAALSLLLLLGYCFLIQSRQHWLMLLFASVFIVNAGYFTLSVSQSLGEALLSNRISYLGSVFLPLSMLMIILDSCKIRCPRWLLGILVCVSLLVFLVAASPGYSDIYYSAVSVTQVNGVTLLQKEYGPWHSLYLFYLLAYFIAMLGFIFYSARKKRLSNTCHAVFLLVAVTVNIGVWLLEQLVDIHFEFLSVSYIISELFLLSLYLLLQEQRSAAPAICPPAAPVEQAPAVCDPPAPEIPQSEEPHQLTSQSKYLADNLYRLTHTERTIYDLYLEGKSTRQIMELLSITENTLKFHNKNLYSKLGVSSRKQLLQLSAELNAVKSAE